MSEKGFILADGTVLKDLKDLKSNLENMSDEEFLSHVNDKKNDFANWVKDSLENEELANKLSSVKTKLEMFVLLEEPLDDADTEPSESKEEVKESVEEDPQEGEAKNESEEDIADEKEETSEESEVAVEDDESEAESKSESESSDDSKEDTTEVDEQDEDEPEAKSEDKPEVSEEADSDEKEEPEETKPVEDSSSEETEDEAADTAIHVETNISHDPNINQDFEKLMDQMSIRTCLRIISLKIWRKISFGKVRKFFSRFKVKKITANGGNNQ